MGDEGLIQSFVQSLLPESAYQRFFVGLRELSPQGLTRLTRGATDYAVLVAVASGVHRSQRVVGLAEVAITSAQSTCEVAVVVSDDCRRQGIATRLLEALSCIAAARGCRRAAGDVLRGNAAAFALATRFGCNTTSVAGAPHIARVTKSLVDGASPACAGSTRCEPL